MLSHKRERAAQTIGLCQQRFRGKEKSQTEYCPAYPIVWRERDYQTVQQC